MSEFLPNQEALTSNTTHMLLGSDCSVRYINHENTTLHVYREDPEVDYCIEYSSDNGRADKIYIDDTRLVGILDELGFTVILRPLAPEDHLDEYRRAENQTRFTEWDIFDPIAQRSLILETTGPMEETSDDFDKKAYDIPISVESEVVVTVEHEGHKLDLTHANAELIEFDEESEHAEFSHICVTLDADEEGIPVVTLIFHQEELMDTLKEFRFPRRILPQITNKAVLNFVARSIESHLEEVAEEEFGIVPTQNPEE